MENKEISQINSIQAEYDEMDTNEDIPLFKSKIKTNPNPDQKFKTRQRTLILSQRKIKAKVRHLIKDLKDVLPHSKGSEKHDAGRHDSLEFINDICMSQNCNNVLFFQEVGLQDFLYLAKSPSGPTVKFRLHNISTMEELRMTGNCLKGSRPLLHFDKQFDSTPKWKLLREMLVQTFSTPHKHPKSKPFVDHIFGFYVCEDKIFFRNYQVLMRQQKQGQKYELVEIGPRFVLEPLRVLTGSFKGETIYNSDHFVSKALLQKIKNEEYRSTRIRDLQNLDRRVALLKKERDDLDAVFEDEAEISDVDEKDLTDTEEEE